MQLRIYCKVPLAVVPLNRLHDKVKTCAMWPAIVLVICSSFIICPLLACAMEPGWHQCISVRSNSDNFQYWSSFCLWWYFMYPLQFNLLGRFFHCEYAKTSKWSHQLSFPWTRFWSVRRCFSHRP